MNVECEVNNDNLDARIVFENVGHNNEKVHVIFEVLRDCEWKRLGSEIVSGNELIKAIQKAQFC